ncbi:hypothetical protein [Rhodobacter calidifons]|nr:hypothetical protein [Rhodobacter calidifons]
MADLRPRHSALHGRDRPETGPEGRANPLRLMHALHAPENLRIVLWFRA